MNHLRCTPSTASLVAGIALAAMAALAAFGNLVAIDPLVTPGDPARTVQDIAAAETLFRAGIVSLVIVALLDVVVAVALRTVFEPVNRPVSTTAAWFRIVYAAVFLLAISQLVVALTLLGDAERAARALEAFEMIWQAGLILFAVHLLLIGYLAYRSGFMPRVLGILLLVAGLGYLIDGVGTVLVPGYSVSIAQFTFVGEVALIFWLLIKGRRMHSTVPDRPPSTVDDRARSGVS
jgi:hypothetical protein